MLDPTKKYKLRNKPDRRLINPIQIAAPDREGNYDAYPVSALVEHVDGREPAHWVTWTSEGQYYAGPDGLTTDLALVEDLPEWADWPIDAKVLVRKKGQQEQTKAHYAGEVDGKPTVWILGVTSWTAEYLVGDHPIRQFAFEIKLAEEHPE